MRRGRGPSLWPLAVLVVGLGTGVATTAALEGCTPAARKDAVVLTDSILRAGCIVVRAVTDDGTAQEVCATAEDLAPLFGELVAAHDANQAAEPSRATVVAAALPTPKKRAPLRRCAAWVPASFLRDGGSEGGDGGR